MIIVKTIIIKIKINFHFMSKNNKYFKKYYLLEIRHLKKLQRKKNIPTLRLIDFWFRPE